VPLIQTSEQGRKLQQGLRLTSLPDSVLAPEIVPVIIVEDYSAPLLGTSKGCTGAVVIPISALNFSLVVLRRPTSIRVNVNRVIVSSATPQQIQITMPTALPVTAAIATDKVFTDFNTPGRPSAVFQGDNTSAVILPGRILYRFRLLANTPAVIPMDILLGHPDVDPRFSEFMINTTLINTDLAISLDWTESPPLG